MIVPPGVIFPIAFVAAPVSVNHRFPSGPSVMSFGAPWVSPLVYSVIVPLGVILPIALVVPLSTNQTLPSGPSVTANGLLPVWIVTGNSLIETACAADARPPTSPAATHAASTVRRQICTVIINLTPV